MALPWLVRSTWLPAPSGNAADPGPQGWTCRPRPAVAAAVEPTTRRPSGLPSTVMRSVRHVSGTVGPAGGSVRPGMPTSAMPTGRMLGRPLRKSTVLSCRTPSTVTRIVLPWTAGKLTGTWTVPFVRATSATGGTSAMTGGWPSAWMLRRVGTEWCPSATTDRFRWSKVTGRGCWSCNHWPICSPSSGLQKVLGSPSKALSPRFDRSPGRRADDVMTMSDAGPVVGRPSRWSTVSSDA